MKIGRDWTGRRLTFGLSPARPTSGPLGRSRSGWTGWPSTCASRAKRPKSARPFSTRNTFTTCWRPSAPARAWRPVRDHRRRHRRAAPAPRKGRACPARPGASGSSTIPITPAPGLSKPLSRAWPPFPPEGKWRSWATCWSSAREEAECHRRAGRQVAGNGWNVLLAVGTLGAPYRRRSPERRTAGHPGHDFLHLGGGRGGHPPPSSTRAI